MNKLLKSARRLTDRPTFITNMASLFSITVLLFAFSDAVTERDVYGWLLFAALLVVTTLTLLAAHDDYREFIAHAVNRRKKANV